MVLFARSGYYEGEQGINASSLCVFFLLADLMRRLPRTRSSPQHQQILMTSFIMTPDKEQEEERDRKRVAVGSEIVRNLLARRLSPFRVGKAVRWAEERLEDGERIV